LPVVNSILGWREKDSLVVAIYGQWGSGKSSLKNLIVEELKSATNSTNILNFNPSSWPASDGIL
jgi:predicted KAP-like P-loop ATPase